jgi:hypothetical protein
MNICKSYVGATHLHSLKTPFHSTCSGRPLRCHSEPWNSALAKRNAPYIWLHFATFGLPLNGAKSEI